MTAQNFAFRLIVVAVIIFAASRLTGYANPPALPVPEKSTSGARIVYPDASPFKLALPGGERRAVRSLLNISQPMHYGQFVWNDRGVAAGRAWVRVDLARQTISVFRAGHEIGTAIILYGADGKPTPAGRFPVLAKRKDHISSLYDAPMPFTLRLTGDGIAIHGSDVRARAATHGCIGVPLAFAEKLFEEIGVGDLVVILPAGRSETVSQT